MAQRSMKTWENWHRATKWMTDEQRGAFWCKVMDYAYDGIEPEITPVEGMAWEFIKVAIDEAAKASENGSKGGRPEKQKTQRKTTAKTTSKTPVETPQKTPSETHCDESKNPSFNEYEYELEDEYEKEGNTRKNAQDTFPLQCLAALNEVMGATYGTLPPKVDRFLERNRNRYTVEDVRAMVAYKRDEWQGTEFARNLTPQTLFSPDHFEQYVHQSKMPKPTRSAKEPKEVSVNAELGRIIGGIQASVIRA